MHGLLLLSSAFGISSVQSHPPPPRSCKNIYNTCLLTHLLTWKKLSWMSGWTSEKKGNERTWHTEFKTSLAVSIFSCNSESHHCDLTAWLGWGNMQAKGLRQSIMGLSCKIPLLSKSVFLRIKRHGVFFHRRIITECYIIGCRNMKENGMISRICQHFLEQNVHIYFCVAWRAVCHV